MDVPFSNEFLMPCCVGCSADDDYDDFEWNFVSSQKQTFWPKITKTCQHENFSMHIMMTQLPEQDNQMASNFKTDKG